MNSSSDNALKQLDIWSKETRAPKIRASFDAPGIRLFTFGRFAFDRGRGEVQLMDEVSGKANLIFSIASSRPADKIEPLLDAPDEHKFKADFFVAVGFEFPFGKLGLFEVAD